MYRKYLQIGMVFVLVCSGCNPVDKHFQQDIDLLVDERVENLLSEMTLEEKAGFLTGKDMWHLKSSERLGIPEIQVTDCGHGVTVILDEKGHYSGCATCFPTAVGQAATWNRELVLETGAAIAREARALGSSILLAPMVNIHRTPFGGRNYETYSEDPYLTGMLASSFIQGVQSESIGAVIKAVTANNQQAFQGHHSVEVSERALREIYLPAFRIAVRESDPWGIMTSYNKVNGEYTSANKHLVTDIIKDEWQYKGFIVSDWRGTHGMEALYAGLDLEMPGPGKILTADAIIREIESGRFTEKELDDRTGRILRAIIKTIPSGDENGSDHTEWNTERHHELARKVAEESVILLKNSDNLLPLKIDEIQTLAVIGPNAREARIGGGGSASVTACYTVSPLEGITRYCGDELDILFEEGCGMKGNFPAIYTQYLQSVDGTETVNGLKGEYFNGKELSGDPVLVRTDEKVDFSWGWAAPCKEVDKGDYSVRWSGQVVPPVTGKYLIGISCSEGGARFYIDEELVIDQWGQPYGGITEAGFKRFSDHVNISMKEGVPHDIKIEFHKKANRNSIRLEWQVPGQADPAQEAAGIASECDVAIVFAGLSNLFEGGMVDRESLSLPEGQDELIQAVCHANPNTIVVLINGTPVLMPWLDQAEAVLEAYYPGQEGGNAIARILFGEVNPSGKLPETFPAKTQDNPAFGNFPGDRDKVIYQEGIYIGYRHYDSQKIEPLFPFGYGLSYTTFEYNEIKIEQDEGNVKVHVTITNTGSVPGKEIVQLYIQDVEPKTDKPVKELKGFKKIFVEPGLSAEMTFVLRQEHFSYFDERSDQWIAEPGEYGILVGSSSRDIRLSEIIQINN